ncbi:ROK family protein [Alkalitalea saponilacus]|uniref:Glucokinase n=1 Tax=Alkalitalea saponilacus TaxID=889453 RepID=A0A1T5HSW7_9BACT|nr:ROK family protein [Alkalitalea saponilacus]ASB47660.1 sugar kinase [Alkalitalea saponilacus]SKC23799.1 glucokinase [Alkalitalea saponilacus]
MLRDLSHTNKPVVGVFLGGKTLKVGRVSNDTVEEMVTVEVDNYAGEEDVLNQLIKTIESVFTPEIAGIGIGVPSMVDVEQGIVYNVEHIPSWRKVYLGDLLKAHFKKEIYVNNDANCFAVGEKYYGKGWKYNNLAVIFAGEGLGVGIIADNRLYSGTNCGAGEFGYISYRDHNYEYYCTQSYFELKYGLKPNALFKRAKKEDKIALAILEQFGYDFGNFIKTILFAIDPECIIIGGDITRFFPYFEPYMWKTIRKHPFEKAIEKLRIDVSEKQDVAVLGAAALYFDAEKKI